MNSTMSRRINLPFAPLILALGVLVAFFSSCEAFAPALQIPTTARITPSTQHMLPVSTNCDISSLDSVDSLSSSLTAALSSASSSSMDLSAATLDPTTVLSDVLGVFIGTPIILLVPIVAALAVAGILVWGIVGYANPEVEDDEI